VNDIEAARAELIGHGVDVSEVFHFAQFGGPPVPGPDPERRSYSSLATFSDPDGNTWLLQEVTARLPGRGLSLDVAGLTDLLRETEHRHGDYEAIAPEAPLVGLVRRLYVARERGRTPEEAAGEAALHMEGMRK
jgi:hypothetical protein